MIIFGTRTTVRLLAMLNFVCGRCGNPSAHRLEERIRKFTLFFIPLFPIGGAHYVDTCVACGRSLEVTEEQAEVALAQVGRELR